MNLSSDHFPAAAAAVADALLPEPFYQSITIDHDGDGARRRQVLCAYMKYAFEEARRTGLLDFAPDPAHGAAVWLLPRDESTEARETAAKGEFLRALLGPAGFANHRRIVGFMEPRGTAVVPARAWYLSILGVLPAAQGRGIGAQMLAPALAAADRAGAVCYLESFSERNPAFYGRLGFDAVATHLEPTTAAPYRIMLRRPR